MNHRLYLIEGLPCSGKSTTSAFVADVLEERHAVCLADEGSGNYPADFEFHAFLSKHAEKWQNFCNHADRNMVYDFHCVLLQNPMFETMMRFDFAEKHSEVFIRSISEIISDMELVVIYLRNDDIAASVRNAEKNVRDALKQSLIIIAAAYMEGVSMQSDLTDISVVWKNDNVVNCKFFQGCRSNI